MTADMSMDRRRKELLLFFFTTHSRRNVYALFFSTGRVYVFDWVGNSLAQREIIFPLPHYFCDSILSELESGWIGL